MKVTKGSFLSCLILLIAYSSYSNCGNPMIKGIATLLQNKEGTLGNLARIYNQFDTLNNPQEQQDDLLLLEETVQDSVDPDSDPSQEYNYPNYNYEDTDDNTTVYPIDYTDDPTFSDGGRKYGDDTYNLRTSVWGVLTEPLRGSIHTDANDANSYSEYIPSSHVKFLEQTGAKVIPISYKLDRKELYNLLDQVNGIYITGDSAVALTEEQYQATISYIITYIFNTTYDDKQYFPAFFMGNSIVSYMQNRVRNGNSLFSDMNKYFNQNMQLRTVVDPEKTYIFDELTIEDLDEVVHNGAFFYRQKDGIKVKDFKQDSKMNKRYQIVATYKTSSKTSTSGTPEIVDTNEFIAILENKDMPIYFLTFQLDFTQFVFNDVSQNSKHVVDHTIYSRNLAQFVAKQILDEAKHCNHTFSSYDDLYSKLIRHQELANVQYTTGNGESSMPKGLELQEIYFIK